MIGRMIYNICCQHITSAHSMMLFPARFLCNTERRLTIDFRSILLEYKEKLCCFSSIY
jgi:hypothetical protein